MKKSVLAIALAVLMAVSLLTVGAMAEGTGSGTADDPYTSVAAYNAGIANSAKDGQDVYLTITGGSFTEGQFNLSSPEQRQSCLNCTENYRRYFHRQYGRRWNQFLFHVPAQLPGARD